MQSRTAIVTGAGSGVGRAVATALLKTGWNVVLCGRTRKTLEATASLIAEHGGEIVVLPCDVTIAQDIEQAFETVVRHFGRLDILFNNAGSSSPPALIDEISPEAWQRVVDVNLTGTFLCARQAFRIMRQQTPQGGRIINNGSISGHAPRPGSVPYTATKHAITGLTKALSLDSRPFSIASGQIDIGNAATDMTTKMSQGVPQADGSRRIEPTMDVKCVADAVLYMANLPLTANVLSMTVMASSMPFVGRG